MAKTSFPARIVRPYNRRGRMPGAALLEAYLETTNGDPLGKRILNSPHFYMGSYSPSTTGDTPDQETGGSVVDSIRTPERSHPVRGLLGPESEHLQSGGNQASGGCVAQLSVEEDLFPYRSEAGKGEAVAMFRGGMSNLRRNRGSKRASTADLEKGGRGKRIKKHAPICRRAVRRESGGLGVILSERSPL